jgi:hypothetical protein
MKNLNVMFSVGIGSTEFRKELNAYFRFTGVSVSINSNSYNVSLTCIYCLFLTESFIKQPHSIIFGMASTK